MDNPLKISAAKIKRTTRLAQILGKYGFEDLKFKQDTSFYERIRRAIEELGPAYIKFGQTLSTREDLLPAGLILELKKLQDNVPVEELDIVSLLQEELDLDTEEVFLQIDAVPIASASIAQVYRATLQQGDQVILKIRRPGIRAIVEVDLLLIRDIVNLLTSYYSPVQEINLLQVFEAFSNSLTEELSFNNEKRNIEQFRHNFVGHSGIVTMKVYPELSNDNILCISYIEGAKINDLTFLQTHGIAVEKTLDLGLNLFLTQVLEHGFFHADPHPGNIFVTAEGKVAFIDFGAMGKMLPRDKDLLEDFVVYLIDKDAVRLVSTIKKMALQINVSNEKLFERTLQEMLDMIGSQSLREIDIKALFSRFSHILNQNNVIMPEHVYLLVKGIVLMEGIGRALAPDINIIDKVKPYIDKIMLQRMSFDRLFDHSVSTLWELRRLLDTAPQSLSKLADKVGSGEINVRVESQEFVSYRKQQLRSSSLNRLLALFCTFFIAGCLLIGAPTAQLWGLSIVSWGLFLLSLIILFVLIVKRLRLS